MLGTSLFSVHDWCRVVPTGHRNTKSFRISHSHRSFEPDHHRNKTQLKNEQNLLPRTGCSPFLVVLAPPPVGGLLNSSFAPPPPDVASRPVCRGSVRAPITRCRGVPSRSGALGAVSRRRRPSGARTDWWAAPPASRLSSGRSTWEWRSTVCRAAGAPAAAGIETVSGPACSEQWRQRRRAVRD